MAGVISKFFRLLSRNHTESQWEDDAEIQPATFTGEGLRVVVNAREVLESLYTRLGTEASNYDQAGNYNRAVVRDSSHRLNIIRGCKTSQEIEDAFDGIQPEELIQMAENELQLLKYINEELDVKPWGMSQAEKLEVERKWTPRMFGESAEWAVDENVADGMLEEILGTSDPDLLFETEVPGMPERTRVYQQQLREAAKARQEAAKAAEEETPDTASQV